ncbi:tethering complex subunit PEP3 [Sporobolomyces koalae]|uniref:tethering complex subunit PEP3 n=1 Tax=Sporobolomyces koalae TaxID=500713 RepID=UPI003174F64C
MDDFVERSGAGTSLAVPIQGWEDGAVYEAGHTEDDESPIFSLGRVQFALPSPLFSLSCTSNILLLCVRGIARSSPTATSGGSSPQLIRIDLDRPTEVDHYDLPLPPPTASRTGAVTSLHQVHVDPTGRHVLVSTTTGDNYYLYTGPLPSGLPSSSAARKAKPLNRLKGAIIEAVSWAAPTSSSTSSSSTSTSFSTREILLGTASGQILETLLVDPSLSEPSGFSIPVPGRSGPERYVKQLCVLPERHAITGLRYEVWGKRVAVIATTQSRIVQLVGSLHGSSSRRDDDGGILELALQPYSSGQARPKTLELPGDAHASELHFFSPPRAESKSGSLLPRSIAWLTGPGIYHGTLLFPSSSVELHPGDGVIESASLVPYPGDPIPSRNADQDSTAQLPISMALTEWHFVLLYEDKVRAIDLLSDKIVYEEALDLSPGDRPIRLATDPVRKTCWMFTESSIYELVIKDEDRQVWKVYLARQNWALAKRYAKTQRQRDAVLAAEADSYFAAGRYIQSAQSYAQSSKSFEEVVLRFVDKNERDALRYYLVAKLERLRRTDVTQRMMLATWLVEIYLAKINELDDAAAAERASEDADNIHAERSMVEEDMRHFLSTYKENLDPRTVYDLLGRHGRDEITLFYASTINDHDRIIRYHVTHEEWTQALQALAKQDNLDLYYRYAAILVRNTQKEAVDAFIRRTDLDVRRLIPALTTPRASPSSVASTSSPSYRHIIRYLQFTILELQNTDPSVHNTLLTLYATYPDADEADFINFIHVAPTDPDTGDPYYDLDYALRLCRLNKRVQACVLIYSKMKLYESSVDLALEHDDLELAKISADQPEDDDMLRKKLWLKIARHVVDKKNDIKAAMRFLEATDLLKIEDILPFFPDFVVIDDFKDEICDALEGYSAHIEKLKEDMNEATRSAEAIKSDIADLENRFVVVDANEKCGSCAQQLLTRQFYVFPCQHAFHADCLIKEVTKSLSPTQLRRMLDLQARLAPAAAPTRQQRRTLLDDTSAQGLKLAAASVQGLDQLRKLVLPDALLGAIGGAIPGSTKIKGGFQSIGAGVAGISGAVIPITRTTTQDATTLAKGASAKKEAGEKRQLREQLDELLASSCVLCEGAIKELDRPFFEEGEEM